MQKIQQEMVSSPDKEEAFQKLVQEYQDLIDHSRAFIQKALGKAAYEEIFAGRRPNSVDHVNLCAYIYEEILKGREKIVSLYIDLPRNREERRAATKTANKVKSRE